MNVAIKLPDAELLGLLPQQSEVGRRDADEESRRLGRRHRSLLQSVTRDAVRDPRSVAPNRAVSMKDIGDAIIGADAVKRDAHQLHLLAMLTIPAVCIA